MTFPFGSDFTAYFFPFTDNARTTVTLTSQTPAIYIFDSLPSRSLAASGPGTVGSTITSWTWDPAKNGFYFTVPAIDDPSPTSTAGVKSYFAAINYLLQTGEQTQTEIIEMILERVKGVSKSVTVSGLDLITYYGEISNFTTDGERTNAIAVSTERIKAALRSSGYNWAQINRLDRLNTAVVLRALMHLMFQLVQEGNDKYTFKYQEFKEDYNGYIESLRLEYDSDSNSTTDAEVQKSNFIWVTR